MKSKQVLHLCYPPEDVPCDQSTFQFQRTLKRTEMRSVEIYRWPMMKPAGIVTHHFGLLRNIVSLPKYALFAQCHRMSGGILFPLAYLFEPITYSFDCWPYRYDAWEHFYRRMRVRLAFITSKQSAEQMQRRLPQMKILWMPECCSAEDYNPGNPLVDRSIDVLELGRRHAEFHERIREPLRAADKRHLYEDPPRHPVFAGRDALVDGYADTRINVCFPASMTHPQWAQGVETTTLRYFEAMASRTLMYGHAPAELIEIMGFNPVIEADPSDPAAQLLEILSNIQEYQTLVDRAHERFLAVGTCEVRARAIIGAIIEHGYRV